MKRKICTMIIGVIFALNGYTQSNINVVRPLQGDLQPNVITMTSKHLASVDINLYSALRFQNIDLIKGEFTGENLTGKYFTLICKDIWNGEITEVDTIVSPKTYKTRGPTNTRRYYFVRFIMW